MASTSETGIDVNVANFGKLILTATGFGLAYNPSNNTITLQALHGLAAKAELETDLTNKALAAHMKAANEREVDFGPLKERVTQIINALESSGVSEQVLNNAKTFVHKIRGQRSTPKWTADEKEALAAEGKSAKQQSASQMGYDNRIANFGKLINILETEPLYTPNEEVLKIGALKAYYSLLNGHNDIVAAAEVALDQARKQRNAVFSTPVTGMMDVANSVKKYVKSVFTAKSIEYKEVAALKFTRVK